MHAGQQKRMHHNCDCQYFFNSDVFRADTTGDYGGKKGSDYCIDDSGANASFHDILCKTAVIVELQAFCDNNVLCCIRGFMSFVQGFCV